MEDQEGTGKKKKRPQRKQIQIRLTITEGEQLFLQRMADILKTTQLDVAVWSFRLGQLSLKSQIEQITESVRNSALTEVELEIGREILKKLASGEWVSDGDLCASSYALDVEIDTLIALRNRLFSSHATNTVGNR